jgi:hypothetical protein
MRWIFAAFVFCFLSSGCEAQVPSDLSQQMETSVEDKPLVLIALGMPVQELAKHSSIISLDPARSTQASEYFGTYDSVDVELSFGSHALRLNDIGGEGFEILLLVQSARLESIYLTPISRLLDANEAIDMAEDLAVWFRSADFVDRDIFVIAEQRPGSPEAQIASFAEAKSALLDENLGIASFVVYSGTNQTSEVRLSLESGERLRDLYGTKRSSKSEPTWRLKLVAEARP